MSTSDSDYSIDWLASDEEDCESTKGLSPPTAEEQPPPSSTTSTKECPRNSICSGPTQSSHRDCKDGDASPVAMETPPVTPVQGLTCVCKEKTLASDCHSARKRARSPGLDRLCERPRPERENELFSQKCIELQCYIPLLSSILHGLRSGRYSERLSSFQESVAMDRIQRIMGVLQNPDMGGHFLSIILKIEEMLHSWFPHIKANVTLTDDGTPAKKQKLHQAAMPPPSLCSSDDDMALRAAEGPPRRPYSTTHLRWLHTSPICSFKTPEPSLSRPSASTSPSPAQLRPGVTQDSAVSSSTDSRPGPPRRLSANPRLSQGPVPLKVSSPCLVRLLQAKESIISPRTTGDASTSEQSWLS
ncbi:hypothetical protein LDENG_00041720 [Lucifuga dentata]|nr:hypothetical protein LDENG_00041720 [Lucifuga dentata]